MMSVIESDRHLVDLTDVTLADEDNSLVLIERAY